jgi:hypothetical protein
VARRTEDFGIDPVIVPIDDACDTSPAVIAGWLADLHRDEPVNLSMSAVEIVRDIREHGEA